MSLYPEVQRKTQEEIERVIGTDRLPTFDDRDNLPYVDAIVKEALRWHPVAPMGVPHMTTEDDIYEGYFIPKGALLLPNIWCAPVLASFLVSTSANFRGFASSGDSRMTQLCSTTQ